jgi:PAS domain S-box-containing protein
VEDQVRTHSELLQELAVLRARIAGLERAEARAEQAEKRLRLSEQRQKAVLDTIPDPVWLTDTVGNLLAVNAAWCRFFGLDAQTVVGAARFDFPSSESAQASLAEDGEVMRSGIEERYRQIVETAAEGIWVVDREWKTVFVNARMAQLLGHQSEELLGRQIFEFMAPEEAPFAQQKMTERAPGNSPSHDFRFMGRGGAESWALVTANPFADDSGGFAGALAMVTDITERKRTETALAKAKEAAETANRAKSEFLANMSHEIRTPMTVILGFSDLLLSPDRTVDERREFLQVIRSSGTALLELIDDILDLSRVEAEKVTVEKSACPLQQALDDILSVTKLRAAAKGLSLQVVRLAGLPEVIHTDWGRLRQILLNLVGNAVKFTEHGEVRLTLQYLTEGKGTGRMQFAVTDTGIGIPAHKLDGLFQPFMQVGGTLTRRYGGTGLGLAISKRLAQALGGDIEVTSVYGQGSTFTLTIDAGLLKAAGLPPASRTRPAAGESLAEELEPAVRARVLLAEDVPGIQLLVLHMARMMNVDIEIADTGQRACELAEQSIAEGRPYDLILMDLQMPQMDGFEATRWLRGQGWAGPIVALTAQAMLGDRERCLNAGCDDYISKPVSTTELWEVLTRYSRPATSVAEPTRTAARPHQELKGDLVDGWPGGGCLIRAGSGIYFESSDFCA